MAPKVGIPFKGPHSYHLLPLLLTSSNQKLLTEFFSSVSSDKVLFRQKRFAVPLIPLLVYGITSSVVGASVGTGVSEAVSAGQDDTQAADIKDYSEYQEYPNYVEPKS